MASSSHDYPIISASQASKEVTANALMLAGSPALLWGIDAPNTAGLTLGLLEGVLNVAGTPTQISATTVSLTGSTTNYVEATTAGVVSSNTSGFTGGRLRLYTVVTGSSTITSYTDHRTTATFAGITGTVGSGDVVGPSSAVNNRVVFFDGTTGKLIKDSGLTLSGSNTGDETTTTIGALINGATAKTTPVDADYVGLMDSAASNILKKLSWANLKATLKTYFDSLYAPATQPIVAGIFYPGAPTASALMGVFAAPAGITTLTFAAAISGSSGKALTAATAQTDIDVRKNATTSGGGSSVGTIRFAAAGTVPTFIAASGFTLTGGTDYLSFWAPATPDATLADIGVSIYGTR